MAGLYGSLPFPEERTPGAATIFGRRCSAMPMLSSLQLPQTRPAQENRRVGSGFSSAVMLDTVDRFFDHRPQITLIEPFDQPQEAL
jgi:hypothetical protein